MIYSFFKKKNSSYSWLLGYYEILFRSKNQTKILNDDVDTSFPVFLKGIMYFIMSGKIVRKKRRQTHLNQTITIESFLSRNIVRVMVQRQFPLLRTR